MLSSTIVSVLDFDDNANANMFKEGHSATMTKQPEAREIYAFGGKTFIENIAVRADGILLLSTFENGRLYSLDPSAAHPTAELVAEFPGSNGITGVVANSPDTFTVTGGDHGLFQFTRGSMKAYTVTFPGPGQAAIVRTVADIPDTEMLNGLVALPSHPHIVLSADSIGGRVYRINTVTGAVDVAFSDERFGPTATTPLGMNGIKIFDSKLYFANSAQGFFGYVPISPDGSKVGDIEVIAHLPGEPSVAFTYDDFDISTPVDGNPTAYVATHRNLVYSIDLVTKEQTLYFGGGDSTALRHATSAAISKSGKSVYIVTGGFWNPGEPARGQVVEVQIS